MSSAENTSEENALTLEGPASDARPSDDTFLPEYWRLARKINLDIESVAASQIGDPLKLAALIEHVIEAAAKEVRTRRFIGRLIELFC